MDSNKVGDASVKAYKAASPAKTEPDKTVVGSSGTAPGTDGYFESVSRSFRTAKHASIITLALFLLFSFTFLRGDITLENLRYLLKFISFTNTETSISAAKINYASGDSTRLDILGSDLCTLTNSVYALYDSRGNQIMTQDVGYKSPVLKVSSKFSLCYDLGGNTVKIFNTFTMLHEISTEFAITDAVIADSGMFAVATGSRDHHTAVTFYDSDFTPTVKVLRRNRLTALELRPDGSELAVMTFGAKNGGYTTTVEVILPGETSAKHTAELDVLGYQLYMSDEGYVVVSDESLIFLDTSLDKVKEIPHAHGLSMTEQTGKYFTALYSSGLINNSYLTVVYSHSGDVLYSGELEGRAIAIDCSDNGDYVFIHTGSRITRINLINRKIGSIEVEPDAIDMLASGKDTVLAAYRNYALTYELDNFSEHYFDALPTSDTDSTETSENEKGN